MPVTRKNYVAAASAAAQASAAATNAESVAGIDSVSMKGLNHTATVLNHNNEEFKKSTEKTSHSVLPLLNLIQEKSGEGVGLGLYIFLNLLCPLIVLGDLAALALNFLSLSNCM